METHGPDFRRVLIASAFVFAVYMLAPAAEEAVEGTWAADVAATIGVQRAEAQWGISRRTARRTARRTVRRYDYATEGADVNAVMVQGHVVYVDNDEDEDENDALLDAFDHPLGSVGRRGPSAHPPGPVALRAAARHNTRLSSTRSGNRANLRMMDARGVDRAARGRSGTVDPEDEAWRRP